jgi:hypothetical protein
MGYEMNGQNSIPGSGKRFFSVPQRPDRLLRPNQWVQRAIFLGVKCPGREADYSHPSSAEVKNDGAVPPFSIRLHGMVPYVYHNAVSLNGLDAKTD